jgi:hypothetical protein
MKVVNWTALTASDPGFGAGLIRVRGKSDRRIPSCSEAASPGRITSANREPAEILVYCAGDRLLSSVQLFLRADLCARTLS